jgi:geranylgeranyl diphosphate synthase type I
VIKFLEDIEPGELQEAVMHLIRAGGKRLRPFVTVKSCELVGGKEDDAIPFAVALEVLHNFTLVHDDIMDRSRKRRGIPTVHAIWGIPIAIIAGDMLFAKVYEILFKAIRHSEIPLDRALSTFEVTTDAISAVCRGQAYDILLAKKGIVREEEYFNLIKLKTASLYEASAKIGAIIGGGNADEVNRLASFGRNIGMAFQIRDDILGLVGAESTLKKPVGDDIKEGKRTLIMVHALREGDEAKRNRILSVLGNKKAKREDVDALIELLKSLGSIDYAIMKAEDFIAKAKADLMSFPDSMVKNNLSELADFIVKREY